MSILFFFVINSRRTLNVSVKYSWLLPKYICFGVLCCSHLQCRTVTIMSRPTTHWHIQDWYNGDALELWSGGLRFECQLRHSSVSLVVLWFTYSCCQMQGEGLIWNKTASFQILYSYPFVIHPVPLGQRSLEYESARKGPSEQTKLWPWRRERPRV
jgi:hypothetical protein